MRYDKSPQKGLGFGTVSKNLKKRLLKDKRQGPPRREDRRQRRPQDHTFYTPLRVPMGRIYAQLEDKRILPKPHKLKAPPNRMDEKKYCEYHKDHGHDIDECRLLKAEIEKLIRRGQLKEFIKRDQGSPSRRRGRTPPRRNMDSDKDNDVAPRRVNTISDGIAGEAIPRRRYARRSIYALAPMITIDREPITFLESELVGLELPHDVPLVISPIIENFAVAQILVDIGSSAELMID
ncbi:hypothetical protein LIER_01718 [Lithospermum erythrorhizon]|uniref:Retrotransposon gag domain-containing protein n=1 Tax=Lithospermum erythrorhizon TaxID=34254 RepID=A0AAV3NLW2_LITER